MRAENGAWAPGAELAAPDAVAGTFTTQPIASGDSLAVRGDDVVWVLTISPNPGPK